MTRAMQLIGLFGFASLAIAAPTAANASSIAGAAAPPSGLQGCQGQGPGSCNLVLIGGLQNGGVLWAEAVIYDHSCNVIGNYNEPKQGIAMDSQLRYTVVLSTLRTSGDYNWIGMRYADYAFDGHFACDKEENGSDNVCAHAFPC